MNPCISFIVPAFNEQSFIDRCLSSIVSECERADIKYQLIVVDNGSTDATAVLAKKYTNDVYRIERASVSHARNFGVVKAKNDIIAFIDGDVEITSNWADKIKAKYAYQIANMNFVTGSQCRVPNNGSWIEKHWFSNLVDQLLGGANIITTTAAFRKIGGFDESLKTGEDYDFCERAITAKLEFTKEPRYEAVHLGFPRDIRNFLRREYWHGEGDFQSVKSFLGSFVAQIALLYILLQLIFLTALFTSHGNIAVVTICLLTFGNAAITITRFRSKGIKTLLVSYWLNYLYFCARALSLYKAVANRHKKH
jgi:glycosyltransferase involved in cell wall biosynthesis